MAIALEFIDFVVPIAVIRAKYPGGWEKCLEDHAPLFGDPDEQEGHGGGRVWYDQYLLRDGAMNPWGIERLIEEWKELGFEPFRDLPDGQRIWQDACVVESTRFGPTLPCAWIEVDCDLAIAWLKGTVPGEKASRERPRVGVER